ncbi:hypothetical protein AHAS_Ahas18G0074600 [Arachis hypogaea]
MSLYCSDWACYGVLRFVMENGAKGCEVIVSGKLRAQRAKSMKFKDYIDSAVRHVLLRQVSKFIAEISCSKECNKKKGTYAQANKPASADDEDMDPTQYFENRLKYLADQKAEGINPYPHNRNDSRVITTRLN